MGDNTMNTNTFFLGFLLLAVAVYAAPIEEPASFSSEYGAVVPEMDDDFIVPESDDLDTLLETGAKAAEELGKLKRAALGHKDRSCRYRITINSHAKDKGKKETNKKDKTKKSLSSVYTLNVTPTSKVHGAREYKIQGEMFKQYSHLHDAGHHDSGKPHDASESFKRCHIHAAQKTNGHVLAGSVIKTKDSRCEQWEQNIILGSIKSLTPNFRHEKKDDLEDSYEEEVQFGHFGRTLYNLGRHKGKYKGKVGRSKGKTKGRYKGSRRHRHHRHHRKRKAMEEVQQGEGKFELLEDTDIFGKEGQVHMEYHSQALPNGDIAVHGTGNDVLTEAGSLSGMTASKMVKASMKCKHHISKHGMVKKSKSQKKVEVGNTNGHDDTPLKIKKGREGATPKGALNKKDRPKTNKQETKVSLHVKLLGCSRSKETMLVEDISVEELVQKRLAAGATQLTQMEHPHELDHVAAMAPEQLSNTVTKMAKKLASLSTHQSNDLAMQMMELKPIRAEVLRQIRNGILTGNNEAHELLNALGMQLTQPKLSTADNHEIVANLIDLALDDSMPDNTREQAIYSLENDQCHDHGPSIEALDQVLDHAKYEDGELDEVGEFALQMQHGLMADQVTCQPTEKASILKQNTDRLARTEALLATALSKGKFQYARVMMNSLANSRFERHTAPIEQALLAEDAPDHIRYGAMLALGKLDGTSQHKTIGMFVHDSDEWTKRAAREAFAGDLLEEEDDARKAQWSSATHPTKEEALAQLEKKKGGKKAKKNKKFCTVGPFAYVKDWPLPAEGDFQVIGGIDTGVDASGARGVAKGRVKVYKWKKNVITITAEKQGIGLCGESKPASISLKLMKKTVWKYKKKGGKKKKTKKKVGKKEPVHNEFKNPLDTTGYCATKMSSGKKNCLMGQKVWKKTFFNVERRFQLGPIPCKAVINLTGKWGVQYAFGFLGDCVGKKTKKGKGKKAFAETTALVQAGKKGGKKGKGKKCTPPDMSNDAKLFNGFMIMMSPFAAADLTVKAEINALVVKAGVAAEVNLLDIGLPVVVESCVYGDCMNQCINGQISTKAGGGRVYVYLKTFWRAQDEWDVFNWDGGSWVWPEPKPDVYTGVCSGPSVPLTTPPPPPPVLTTTDCVVDIYANDNFKGQLLKRCNTNTPKGYWCRVTNGGKTENNANSYKMYGKCYKQEILDEDGCKPGYSDNVITYKSEPSIKWDIRDDTCGVKIWAAADVEVYQHGDFDGWRAGFNAGDYNVNDMKDEGAKTNDISSMKVHYGCEATVFSGTMFGGHSATFGPGDYKYNDFIAGGAKNDDVSSIKVKCSSDAFIGCFKDKQSRAMTVNMGTKTTAECAKACKDYTYFGMQAKNECRCGNDDGYKKYGTVDTCTCYSQEKGDWSNCVYATDY